MAKKAKEFTIDDAFEENEEDRIRLYRKSVETSPLKNPLPEIDEEEYYSEHGETPGDVFVQLNSSPPRDENHRPIIKNAVIHLQTLGAHRTEDTTSQDSTSLIQGASQGYYAGAEVDKTWWKHPRVKRNWKTVVAAAVLVFLGSGLFLTGCIIYLIPSLEIAQGFIFFIAGLICLLPGAYHLVYVYLAVKGTRGFDFNHLPLFN